MGRNTGVTDDTKQSVVRFTEEAIVAGDLLWMGEDGLAKKVVPNTIVPLHNSDEAGLAVIRALSSVEPVTAVESRRAGLQSSCHLGDSFVVAYQISASGGLDIAKRSQRGDTTLTLVGAGTGTIYRYKLVKLTETKFAVIWGTSSSSVFVRILDKDLVTIGSTITVSTGGNTDFDICALSDGNLLVAWRKISSSSLAARVWSSVTGAAVTTETSVATTFGPKSISVCALDSGGFAVSWFSAAYEFARFDSAGVIINSLVSIAGAGGEILGGDTTNRLVQLSNNNLAIQYGTNTATPQFRIYNPSNSLVLTISPTMSSKQNGMIAAMSKTSDGFAFAVHTSETVVNIIEYSPTGTWLKTLSLTLPTSFGSLTGNGGAMLFAVPSQGFIYLRLAAAAGGSNYSVAWAMVDRGGNLIGSVVSETQTTDYGSFHAALASNNVLLVHLYHTTMREAVYHVGRKSIIGVALNTPISNKIKVARKGAYTLTSSYDTGGVFDATLNIVKGTRGIVSKDRATLMGVVE